MSSEPVKSTPRRVWRQHARDRLFLLHRSQFSAANLELNFSPGQRFLADAYPDRETDQVRILELYAGTIVAIIKDHIDSLV